MSTSEARERLKAFSLAKVAREVGVCAATVRRFAAGGNMNTENFEKVVAFLKRNGGV